MNRTRSGSRRAFLRRGVQGALAVGLAARPAVAAAPKSSSGDNPWRYDVDRLQRVDPALVQFKVDARFPVAHRASRRVACGHRNEFYVAAGRAVLEFTPQGERSDPWTVSEPVRCVRPAEDGSCWIGFRDHVELYDGHHACIARWPSFPGRPFLTGIAATESAVFVADSGNRVVYRCDLQGRVQRRIGEKNPERGIPGLVLPSPFLRVEIGPDGLLRINNAGRHCVEVYTQDGDLELSWGRAGADLEAFCGCCNPVGLALFADGRCVTSEKGLCRVKVFHPDGRLESVVAGPAEFGQLNADTRDPDRNDTSQTGLDIAVDGNDRVVVLDPVGEVIHVFSRRAGARPAV